MAEAHFPVTPSTQWIKYPRHISWCIRRLIQDEITINTRQGIFTMSSRDSGVAAYLYRGRQYEYNYSLDAVRLLKRLKLIPPDGGTLLDIGANIGMISIGLVLAGEVASAIAIEPEPNNFRLLEVNIEQNKLSQIIPFQMAAGDSVQWVQMTVSEKNHGDHRIVSGSNSAGPASVVDVESAPLTDIVKRARERTSIQLNPSMIWMDVQGYEGFVFNGAQDLISNGLPAVIEIWPAGIINAGMTLDDFAAILKRNWKSYWIKAGPEYQLHSINDISKLLKQVYEINQRGGKAGTKFENIILTGTNK